VWNQRDLWNILYGTNPIYILDAGRWASTKDRLVQSYRNVSGVDRAVGYSQMVDHKFLTADKSVQQTSWSNGIVITVNFGDKPYKRAEGTEIFPMSDVIDVTSTGIDINLDSLHRVSKPHH
jgi:hypothetical protein